MTITFLVNSTKMPKGKTKGIVVELTSDNWDDYSYKTMFNVAIRTMTGDRKQLGTVKIGYVNQSTGRTLDEIEKLLGSQFEALPEGWFSLGQDVDYYQNVCKYFSGEEKKLFLESMIDVVANQNVMKVAQEQSVFLNSFMRGVSLTVINGQYRRVLDGLAALTEFEFVYHDPGDTKNAAVSLEFHVVPASKPPTNVHVLIGRNGVGKTTLLNNMVSDLFQRNKATDHVDKFYEKSWKSLKRLPDNYFSSIVSVSFSAFDPFVPPADQPDRSRGVAYFYIGMKKIRLDSEKNDGSSSKSNTDLANDFIESLDLCLSQREKRERWRSAIKRLQSDQNFEDMKLDQLLEQDHAAALKKAKNLVGRMSSGHSIVLLTITKLIETVEEKTLVLMDEPESHLHPPLLSAFTRALSDLLHNRNGVAIIATHSPVVVQEVPSSCVWKLSRLRTKGRADRPERETFGENVGTLTRDIFGLEVSKSGFHAMLQDAVNENKTFDSIVNEYNDQLGFEAQGILRSMLAARDAKESDSE